MALYKNVASQKIAVYAHDTSADTAKTGDAANITAQISKDGGVTAATNDASPTELDATDAPGIYLFDMTQGETNADLIVLCGVSSTSDISIEPVIIYTLPGDNAGVDVEVVTKTGFGLAADQSAVTIGTVTTNTDLVTAAAIRTEMDSNSTQLAAIVADTNELQTDDVPGLIGALNDPASGDIADAVWDEAKVGHVGAGSFGAEVQDHALSSEVAALNDLSAAEVNTEVDTALTDYDAPTKAELDSGFAGLNDPTAAAIRTEIDSNSTQLAAIVADTNELQTDDIPGLIAALNDLSAAEVNAQVDAAWTTQMPDSVPADGVIATREQALYAMLMFLTERAVSGTTLTVKKVDGSTSLMTFTLDDASAPTSLTRAS